MTEEHHPSSALPAALSELSGLRVVPLGSLLLHEAHDPARLSRLAERISSEGMQRNPIIVSAAGEGRFLVLDGAHRAGALGSLGCPLALVQVVDLPEEAEGWRHLFESGPAAGGGSGWLARALRGTEVVELPDADAEPGAVALVELSGGGRFAVLPAEGAGRTEALWGLQALYPEAGKNGVLRRLAPGESVRPRGGEVLVEYRPLPTEGILADILSGATLPAGITRFRVPGRVLGVRLPLRALLTEDRAAAEKELRSIISGHVRENRVRRYEEPVTLFE